MYILNKFNFRAQTSILGTDYVMESAVASLLALDPRIGSYKVYLTSKWWEKDDLPGLFAVLDSE